MKEVWKDIKESPGYQVSNLGNVRKVKNGKCQLLSKSVTTIGNYPAVNINRKTTNVHRLVATEFIPNPDNKPCVNHIDADRTNNVLTNLEWATYSENIKHGIGLGNVVSPFNKFKGKTHKKSIPVRQLDESKKLIKEYNCIEDVARETGCDPIKIGRVLKGLRKRTGGFYWEKIKP